ncbi:DNA (cytosine-5-)-methyltransferase [Brucella sp. NBRC 12951]|uniref:DNA cytosine methyltransferase n=1 Tax=Brucella sp. NBRC 12951 TaxID=3075479 RepID=UPI003342A543
MRAIDLYAGIGGWGLGLRLADVDIVGSYERWKPAIDTHNANLNGQIEPVDIRKLDLTTLPSGIELVVGSPPCTEFSYANRGGSGDIAEGLKDLVKFFEIVEYLQPRFWAMENVPRVAEVLRTGFQTPDHALHRFRHLDPQIEVFDFSDYGTPQARRRCIATNIPLDRVFGYRTQMPKRTLGDVLKAVTGPEDVVDPVWNVSLKVNELTEQQTEAALNDEELRMNREAKEFHPVYNNMAFPDPLDEPARTVTATCTRVSRESIVIADPKAEGRFRRLTIRERACLQGFPITYQFYAKTFAEKAKMIGNAIPPTFTYLLALAARGAEFDGFDVAGEKLALPSKKASITLPDREGRTYPLSRGFRAALPGLRFKSGMRFELANSATKEGAEWRVRFFFGPSKDIREIDLTGEVSNDLENSPLVASVLRAFKSDLVTAARNLALTSPWKLQLAWAHKTEGVSPYEVVDQLGALASQLLDRLAAELDEDDLKTVSQYVLEIADAAAEFAKPVSRTKLDKYALPILTGIIIGEWFNTLDWHSTQKAAA